MDVKAYIETLSAGNLLDEKQCRLICEKVNIVVIVFRPKKSY
jgi:hypothetical protein